MHFAIRLVFALIMAFSCMSVIGNAVIVQSETEYDSIDDAALTPDFIRVFLYWRTKNMEVKLYETIN